MSFMRWGYTFEGVFSSPDQLPPGQGVYVIWCRISKSDWKVLDVGESDDVRDRVMNHERSDCWRRNCTAEIRYSATYTPGSTENARRNIEAHIRNQVNVPCGEH